GLWLLTILGLTMVNSWGIAKAPVSYVTPPGKDWGVCEVDTQGSFDYLPPYNGRITARYHRSAWWIGQCEDGALVEVSEAMVQSWQADRENTWRLTEPYDALRGR